MSLNELLKSIDPLLLMEENYSLIKEINFSTERGCAEAILEASKTLINSSLNNEKQKNLFEILSLCAHATINPPRAFDQFIKMQQLDGSSLYETTSIEIQKAYTHFFETAKLFIKNKKINCKSNIQSLPVNKTTSNLDTKNQTATQQRKFILPTLPKHSKPTLKEVLNIRLRKQSENILGENKMSPSTTITSLNQAKDTKPIGLPHIAIKTSSTGTQQLENEIKMLKEKLQTQHLLLLDFNNRNKVLSNENQILKNQVQYIDKFKEAYIYQPSVDGTLSQEIIDVILNYLVEDILFVKLFEAAQNDYANDPEKLDLFHLFFQKFKDTNKKLLFGENKESYLASEDLKSADEANHIKAEVISKFFTPIDKFYLNSIKSFTESSDIKKSYSDFAKQIAIYIEHLKFKSKLRELIKQYADFITRNNDKILNEAIKLADVRISAINKKQDDDKQIKESLNNQVSMFAQLTPSKLVETGSALTGYITAKLWGVTK